VSRVAGCTECGTYPCDDHDTTDVDDRNESEES
jgi:hypothetical protein